MSTKICVICLSHLRLRYRMMKLIFLRLRSGQEYSIGENSSNLLRSLDTPFTLIKIRSNSSSRRLFMAMRRTGFKFELCASKGTSIIFLLIWPCSSVSQNFMSFRVQKSCQDRAQSSHLHVILAPS